MVDFSLKNKVALITGASRGIGEAISETLAEYGAHCILVSRKMDYLRTGYPSVPSDTDHPSQPRSS